MLHRSFSSSRARVTITWGLVVGSAAAASVVLGGCPGPEPQAQNGTDGSGGNSATNGSGSTRPPIGGGGFGGTGLGGDVSAGGRPEGGGGPGVSTGSGVGGGPTCPSNEKLCDNDGKCHDLATDPDHCGNCGTVCPTAHVDQRGCNMGMCQIVCAPGFVNVKPANAVPDCTTAARRVFVSEDPIDMFPMGGIPGADKKCKDAADAAQLRHGGAWHAWVSTGVSPISNTIPGLQFHGAYVTVDGTKIIATAAELRTGMIRHAIDVTEYGGSVMQPSLAWTGSTPKGIATLADCTGWTNSSDGTATVGVPGAIDNTWAQATSPAPCSTPQHLYCFEGD